MKQEELFDIVDENNQPTGEQSPRSTAHSVGLWHRAVHIYFFRNTDNGIELLVHLRAKTKDLNPDRWDTRFGGHLSAGESVAEALTHEAEEETGLTLGLDSVLEGPEVKRNKFPNCEFTKVFFYEFTGHKDDLKFNDGEVQRVEWMSLNEIEKGLENHPNNWSATSAAHRRISAYLTQMISRR